MVYKCHSSSNLIIVQPTIAHTTMNPLIINQKCKGQQFLHEDDKEVILFHRKQKSQTTEERDDDITLVSYQEPFPQLEDEEDEGFLGQCNISCIDLSTRDYHPEVRNRVALKERDSSGRRVAFHRYDEHIDNLGGKSYVYSIHDREVEEERNSFDVIDRVEEGVSDLQYFFGVLKNELADEAKKRIAQLPINNRKYTESHNCDEWKGERR